MPLTPQEADDALNSCQSSADEPVDCGKDGLYNGEDGLDDGGDDVRDGLEEVSNS